MITNVCPQATVTKLQYDILVKLYCNISINCCHTIWCKTLSLLGFLGCKPTVRKVWFCSPMCESVWTFYHIHVWKLTNVCCITSVSSSRFIQTFGQVISGWLMQSKTAWCRYHPTIFVHFWLKCAIYNFE
jgi:hypothetical protein